MIHALTITKETPKSYMYMLGYFHLQLKKNTHWNWLKKRNILELNGKSRSRTVFGAVWSSGSMITWIQFLWICGSQCQPCLKAGFPSWLWDGCWCQTESLSFPYSHSSEETLCPVTQLLDKNTRLCVEWDAQTSMGWGSYHILIALDLGYWNLSWDLFNPIGFHFRTIRRVNSSQIRSFSTMGTKWNGWPEIVQCPFIMLHKNISQ